MQYKEKADKRERLLAIIEIIEYTGLSTQVF